MYDVVVIGAGPGGYVAAIRAAQNGLKVACVEKNDNLGGTCLNVGCIPSKSLLQSSELYHMMGHSQEHGITASPTLDFAQMMKRKEGVILSFNQGIAALFKKNKVDHLKGHARFTSPQTLDVSGQEVTAKHFIIATGSEPTPLPFLPFDEKRVLSSTGALALKDIPKSMIVIGAGVIGVELGSVYARLGTKVHFVEFLDRVCPTLDGKLSKEFQKILTKQGLTFQLSTKVTGADTSGTDIKLSLGDETLTADTVLVCIGRRPYTEGLNLESANITTDKRGTIPINAGFQTKEPHIYAIGDIVDGPMLAHKASEEGIAVADIIAGQKPHIEYIAIPSVIYTHPEVAAVGLTEEQTKEMNLTVKIGEFPFKANSRAKCMGEEEGLVKMIADAGTGTLLGVHIIGPNAGELIEEAALALEKRATASDIANTSHAHPTLSEAIKEAALAITSKPIHM